MTVGATNGRVGISALTPAGTYHVIATSQADSSKSDSATVTVAPGSPPGPQAACATAPLRTTGTTYYYCACQTGAGPGCVAGNDANPGTSPSAPRQTLADASARFNSMNGGDTVALCRGGAWNAGGSDLSNTLCTAGNTCDWRDYTPTGQTARPRLNVGTAGFSHWGGLTAIRFWNMDVRGTAGVHRRHRPS